VVWTRGGDAIGCPFNYPRTFGLPASVGLGAVLIAAVNSTPAVSAISLTYTDYR
jgi:hypothetical protein